MNKDAVIAWLKKQGTQRNIDGMARYAIVAKKPIGVQMGTLLAMKKKLGTDHDLAIALWNSGWYEARLLAALVGDPERVTAREMNAWAASFENWADCDTVCFKLWDRTPLAWQRAPQWAKSPRELVKRGGFVLMACLSHHDKAAPDQRFKAFLPLIEKGAQDGRNLVMKGVSWALRGIGRRSAVLYPPAAAVAQRLAESESPSARWVGKDALRDFANWKARSRRTK